MLKQVVQIFGVGISLFSGVLLHAQTGNHTVAAAMLNVRQNDEANTTNSVTLDTPISINQFSLRTGSNRGDYNVQIGSSFGDDVNSGVLMACVAENGRDNSDSSAPGINYCTTAIDYSRSGAAAGAYFISCFNAPAGAEFNMDVAAAYFPYTNWIGGFARNLADTNGGPNDLFTGSPGLILGVHYIDNGGGVSTVNLTSLGIDSRTNGVLLVTHGRNTDNFALSQVNTTNGTWTVYIKDNGADAGANEQDPVAFVFIPKTNTVVVSGRFSGDGTRLLYSGASPGFDVTNTSVGTWRLTISGYSPNNGVLILSAEGGSSINQDNIVSYQADGDGWIIQARDLPGNPPGLQTPGTQPVASFVFIPSAMSANLVSPPSNSQNRSVSPSLQVAVTNSVPGNLSVKFYGGRVVYGQGEDFTIVALPDTQFYTDEVNGATKEMYIAQTEWIIANRVSRKIAYVAHLGDISNSGDVVGTSPNTSQWRNATNAMYRLESPTRTLLSSGIPYGMAVGNHDLEPIGDANGTSIFFNQYFGVSHFTGKSYYAGHYGTNNNNHFDFFSAGGLDFIVLYFEFNNDTNASAIAWGNSVLQTNQNRRAIIVTHNFGNTSTPVNFSPQGQAIYNALKGNTNIFMMLAGHVTGAGSRADTFKGNTIRTFVSDYQGWTNGGNGFLRIMTFSPTNNQVVVQTYSPWTGEYRTESIHEFFFTYNMQQASSSTNEQTFALIGTVNNVAPGNLASLVWSNRQVNTDYQWYAVVKDASNNTITTPTWTFSTATNSAPVASSQTITVVGDAPTDLTLISTDANGDPLTFQITSPPLNGLNSNFNAENGAITYLPYRGFRGFDRFFYRATDGASTSSIVSMNLNVVAPPDSNGDGLPDAWANAYGITSPYEDNDGDGRLNFEEYFANTNPTNAASVLRMGDAHHGTNGSVVLSWPSIGGTRYRVQYNNGTTNGSFNGLFTDIPRSLNAEMDDAPYGAPSTQTFMDDFSLTGDPGTNRARYYRVRIVQ